MLALLKILFLALIFGFWSGCSGGSGQGDDRTSSRGSSYATSKNKNSKDKNKDKSKDDDEDDEDDDDDDEGEDDNDNAKGSGRDFDANKDSYNAQTNHDVNNSARTIPGYDPEQDRSVECYEDEGEVKVYRYTSAACKIVLSAEEKAVRQTTCTQDEINECVFNKTKLAEEQKFQQLCLLSGREVVPIEFKDCCRPIEMYCDGPFSDQSALAGMEKANPEGDDKATGQADGEGDDKATGQADGEGDDKATGQADGSEQSSDDQDQGGNGTGDEGSGSDSQNSSNDSDAS